MLGQATGDQGVTMSDLQGGLKGDSMGTLIGRGGGDHALFLGMREI